MVDDATIEEALKEAVMQADLSVATLKTIRADVADKLGLEPEFFKTGEWKARSKSLIDSTINSRLANQELAPSSPPVKKTEPAKELTPNRDQSKTPQVTEPLESVAPEVTKDDDDSDSDPELIDDVPPIKKRKAVKNGAATKKAAPEKKTPTKPAKHAKQTKSKTSTKASSKHQDELAKLKSQLTQCGVRKVWSKLLANVDGEAAQVKYLRQMLADIGMTGRFSKAKAKAIKEKREFEQDIKDMTEEAERFINREPAETDSGRKKRIIMSDSEDDE